MDGLGVRQSGWTAFTATLFDLGVKGLVKVDEVGKKLHITGTGRSPETPLPAAEQTVFDYVRSKASITVDTADGPDLNKKRGELVAAIERENREVYFRNNALYTAGGVLLALAMLAAMIWLDVLDPVFLFVGIIGAIVISVIIGAVFGSRKSNLLQRLVTIVWVGIVGFNML